MIRRLLSATALGLLLTTGAASAADPAKPTKGQPEQAKAEVRFMSFKRAFIVPVTKNGYTTSMVAVKLTLAVEPDSFERLLDREEILRDRILSGLLALSHAGAFDGGTTDPAVTERLKSSALEALDDRDVAAVREVLISSVLSRRLFR